MSAFVVFSSATLQLGSAHISQAPLDSIDDVLADGGAEVAASEGTLQTLTGVDVKAIGGDTLP